MLRWRGLDDIPADWGRCVVTIGVFDGIHRGHQELIQAAIHAAKDRGVPAVLMTFDPHPAEVVRPGTHPSQLSTLARRAELAEELGIDVFCVMPFTPALAAQTAQEFAHEILVERLHAAEIVVGANFTFGNRALGTVEVLRNLGERFGFGVQGVSLVSEHAVTFSSTYIRSCVDAGDVAAAAEALARPHRVEGVVVRGDGRGRELGYPTANVAPPMHSAIPADGVYAAWFTLLAMGVEPLGGEALSGKIISGKRYMAAVSIGTNPTFSGRTRTVEAFVIDAEADLYGQHVAVDFVDRVQSQIKFDSVEGLIKKIADDVELTRHVLARG